MRPLRSRFRPDKLGASDSLAENRKFALRTGDDGDNVQLPRLNEGCRPTTHVHICVVISSVHDSQLNDVAVM